jgi:hypothetical protein
MTISFALQSIAWRTLSINVVGRIIEEKGILRSVTSWPRHRRTRHAPLGLTVPLTLDALPDKWSNEAVFLSAVAPPASDLCGPKPRQAEAAALRRAGDLAYAADAQRGAVAHPTRAGVRKPPREETAGRGT